MSLFIHIPKCAGSSIKKAKPRGVEFVTPTYLKPPYFQNLKESMAAESLTHHAGHARWRDLREGHKAKECFAVVRNPWSRTVSRYTFYRKITGEDISFNDWLETRHQYKDRPFWHHRTTTNWQQQKEHVTDKGGNIRCAVLRHEHVEEDLGMFLHMDVKLPERNVSNTGKPYQDYYDRNTSDMIGEWYEEDVSFFGFSFNGAATRGVL